MAPVFFFTYAHDNRSQHGKLDQFFDDLSSMVTQKMGLPLVAASSVARAGYRWRFSA